MLLSDINIGPQGADMISLVQVKTSIPWTQHRTAEESLWTRVPFSCTFASAEKVDPQVRKQEKLRMIGVLISEG